MTNIRIVTDSNSGITQSEAEKLGISVIPMPFLIDGEEYFEDINLTQEQFYEHLRGDAAVSTSQPSVASVTEGVVSETLFRSRTSVRSFSSAHRSPSSALASAAFASSFAVYAATSLTSESPTTAAFMPPARVRRSPS